MDRQQYRKIGCRLCNFHATDCIDENILIEGGDAGMPVHDRQQHRQIKLRQQRFDGFQRRARVQGHSAQNSTSRVVDVAHRAQRLQHPMRMAAGFNVDSHKVGAGADGWSAAEKALLSACDDLNRDHFVSNPAWAELSKHYSERQCMDLVFTVGQYTQVSMILNSFGIQVEDGQTVDPDLKA